MKKIIIAFPIIVLILSILACVFAEKVAGQVLPQDEETYKNIEISTSSESDSTHTDILVSPQDSYSDIAFTSQQVNFDIYLFTPIRATDTYLMNDQGVAVYTWESDYTPGNSVYLLENGNLLRTGTIKGMSFKAGGSGGIVQEIAPDSSIVWEYQYANDQVQQHHDIEKMPNGNILMIAWEYKSQVEVIAAGRNPNLLNDGELWPDHVIEVDPTTNEIVWEWHTWDHLVQDYDPTKENFGVVADHPELIDLNFTNRQAAADWNHINSIDYNAELDQILLSVHNFSEIWIIDHSIATEEAAGTSGDLLYRWGNPQAYAAGSVADQQFYVQHDAQWISSGYPGEGNILVFNNGNQRTRPYSSVDEIAPPMDSNGNYTLVSGSAYGPVAPKWTYAADNPPDFFADHISGVQRLSNGNTLICSGTEGLFFEVTSAGEIVWKYAYGSEVFRLTEIASNFPGLTFLTMQPGEELKAEAKDTGGQPLGQGARPGDTGPPQKAIDACSNLTESAACTIQNPNRKVSGSCQSILGQLACVPSGRP